MLYSQKKKGQTRSLCLARLKTTLFQNNRMFLGNKSLTFTTIHITNRYSRNRQNVTAFNKRQYHREEWIQYLL